MKTVDLIFLSDYGPGVCLAKIKEQIDIDQFTLFSFSGYKGDKPIVGRVAGNDFRLHRRRYWHNSFGPILFGRAIPDGSGTRFEAYWSIYRWTRVSLRIWLALAVLMGAPMFFNTIRQIAARKPMAEADLWLGIIVPLCLVVVGGFLIPWLGAALSAHEKQSMIDLLKNSLPAIQLPPTGEPREWRSTLD